MSSVEHTLPATSYIRKIARHVSNRRVAHMSPEEKKLITFIRRLFEKTRTGEVPWEPGSDPNVFGVSFPSYSVSIERVPPSEDGPEDLRLRIFNEEVPIAVISAFEAKTLGFENIREFFDGARRTALRLGEALDTLSEELEDLLRQK
jgi:hypothetical protein